MAEKKFGPDADPGDEEVQDVLKKSKFILEKAERIIDENTKNEEFTGKTTFSFLRKAENKEVKIIRTDESNDEKAEFKYVIEGTTSFSKKACAHWAKRTS